MTPCQCKSKQDAVDTFKGIETTAFTPAGMLYVQGRSYLIIANRDNQRDTWEMSMSRYYVVPFTDDTRKYLYFRAKDGSVVYPPPRHLSIMGSHIIEWRRIPKINCLMLKGL